MLVANYSANLLMSSWARRIIKQGVRRRKFSPLPMATIWCILSALGLLQHLYMVPELVCGGEAS
jgi:hypothetical protein